MTNFFSLIGLVSPSYFSTLASHFSSAWHFKVARFAIRSSIPQHWSRGRLLLIKNLADIILPNVFILSNSSFAMNVGKKCAMQPGLLHQRDPDYGQCKSASTANWTLPCLKFIRQILAFLLNTKHDYKDF